MTFRNNGTDAVTISEPLLILSGGIDKWELARIDDLTVEASESQVVEVDATVPLVRPGQYGLFVYGFGPGGVLFVDEPTDGR